MPTRATLREIWRAVSGLLDELRELKVQSRDTDLCRREQQLMEALALLEQRIAEAAPEGRQGSEAQGRAEAWGAPPADST